MIFYFYGISNVTACYFFSNEYHPVYEEYLIIKEREEKITRAISLREKRVGANEHGKIVFTWNAVHSYNKTEVRIS